MSRRLVIALALALVAAVLMPAADHPHPVAAVEGGRVTAFGGAPDAGSTRAAQVAADIVGIAGTPSGAGYWQVGADGGVFGFGDAGFFGSLGGKALNAPIVGMAATPSGQGYWLVAADGGVFGFGDARFLGGMGGTPLNAPIVGIAATASGGGYWLVASDGGMFTFGDARFYGSTGGMQLNAPIVGMAASSSGQGYWLLASDGGMFNFGDAAFHGSAAGALGDDTAAAVARTPSGDGYWIASTGGRVLPYGAATDDGSLSAGCHDQAVVGIAARSAGGYWLSTAAYPREVLGANADPIQVVYAQSRAMRTLLRVRQACEPTAGPTPGRLSSPLPGSRVTTGYGWRTHPVFHEQEFHAGLDLAGASRILAPADGTVVQVEMRPGYGLTTIIDHGDGIATVLAHQAVSLVHAGDRVMRGQRIGVVGHSGYATGNHLHVEVRVHGVPMNPHEWF